MASKVGQKTEGVITQDGEEPRPSTIRQANPPRLFALAESWSPALLPRDNTASRRGVQVWFRSVGVQPRVVAEFEDLALLKTMGAQGRGFIVLSSVVASEAARRYGFRVVGGRSTPAGCCFMQSPPSAA